MLFVLKDKGAKETQAELAKTAKAAADAGTVTQASADATATAQQKSSASVAKATKAQDAAAKAAAEEEKKRHAEAVKRQKEIADHTKRVGETLGKVRNIALDVAAAFTLGMGIKGFVSTITPLNAALGRTAQNLGMTVPALDTWRNAMKAAGGTADDANAMFGGLLDTFEKLKNHEGFDTSVLSRLKLSARDLQDPEKAASTVRDRLLEYQSQAGHTRQDTQYLANKLGIGESAFNLMMRPDFEKLMASAKPAATDPKTVQNDQELETAFEQLKSAAKKVGDTIENVFAPTITKVINGLTEFATYLSQPGHGPALAATAVGGVGLLAAVGVLAKKVTSSVIASLLPKVAPLIPEAVTGGGAAVAGGAAAAEGGAAAGGAAVAGGVIGTAAATLAWIAAAAATTYYGFRIGGLNNGEDAEIARLRAEGKMGSPPGASPPPTDGLIHQSAFHPGGDGTMDALGTHIDTFWDRFGYGLLDWLSRQYAPHGSVGSGGSGVQNASYTTGGSSSGGGYSPGRSSPSGSGSLPSSGSAPSTSGSSISGLPPGPPVPLTPPITGPTGNQRANVELAMKDAAAQGVDPRLAAASMGIESSFGTNNGGGTYTGPYQLSEDEWKQSMPGKSRRGASLSDEIWAGIATLKRRTDGLRRKLGRDPAPWEVYLAHQQGPSGGPALLSADPNSSAIDAISRFYKTRGIATSAILGNIPSDMRAKLGNNPTVAQFLDVWKQRYGHFDARAMAMLGKQYAPNASDRVAGQTPPPANTSQTTIGDIHVHTPTTNPRSHGEAVSAEVMRRNMVSQANTGMV
jgi:hypothetical protein